MSASAPPTESIASNLADLRRRIASSALAVGRDPDSVTLVAVAKTHGPEAVTAALAAGQRVFGENRVQEAAGKYPALRRDCPDLELHLIGPLQTNKAEEALRLFDVIQTLDRPRLAEALAKARDKIGRCPGLFLQVNTGEEPQKAGAAPAEAEALLRLARDLDLPVQGLMCIPPLDEPPAPHFQLLREMARGFELPLLSMGMSGDFETAVRLGATHVRVGTALFGSRPQKA